MIITYTNNEDDFLIHQLYAASRSKRIGRQRQRVRWLYAAIWVTISVLAFMTDDPFGGIWFLILLVLWFTLYPYWESKRYKKHYKKYIDENLKSRFGKEVTLEISDEVLVTRDHTGETTIKTASITEISDLPKVILIKDESSQSLILPKDKINVVAVSERLRALAAFLKIGYRLEENWKWH